MLCWSMPVQGAGGPKRAVQGMQRYESGKRWVCHTGLLCTVRLWWGGVLCGAVCAVGCAVGLNVGRDSVCQLQTRLCDAQLCVCPGARVVCVCVSLCMTVLHICMCMCVHSCVWVGQGRAVSTCVCVHGRTLCGSVCMCGVHSLCVCVWQACVCAPPQPWLGPTPALALGPVSSCTGRHQKTWVQFLP